MINHQDFEEVQAFYDAQMSKKLSRRREIQAEVARRVEEEEQQDAIELAELMHHKFNLGMTKTELRRATRQYQSPKFKSMWEAAEYVAPESGREKKSPLVMEFRIDGDQVTFHRDLGLWNWDGLEAETLTFTVHESENTGTNILKWGSDEREHALFNLKNQNDIREALKEVEL